jgi:hypothetical protein
MLPRWRQLGTMYRVSRAAVALVLLRVLGFGRGIVFSGERLVAGLRAGLFSGSCITLDRVLS